MKAGAHMAYYAYQHSVQQGKSSKLPITFLYIPEEEVGSPTFQAMIQDEAKKHKYVLVTEPARDGNKFVT
jgi:glutamate carboxypeptidase